MANPYCTRANVYAWIQAAAFVRAPRIIEAVDPAADTLTLRGHSLTPDRLITFALQSAPAPVLGAPAASLPGGLVASTPFYAQPYNASEDVFQVSAVKGGGIVDITSSGSPLIGVIVDFGPDLDEQILDASAWIDVHLPAHGTPVPAVNGVYPRILQQLAARFAARWMITGHGLQNPNYKDSVEAVQKMGDADQAALDGWKAGAPVPWLSAVDATPKVAEAGARSWSLASRGWDNAGRNGDLT